MLFSLEHFFVINGIFRNRVREKGKYIVIIGIYLLIMVPVVLLWKNIGSFISVVLNVAIAVFLFEGKLSTRLLHSCEVYVFTTIAEAIVTGIVFFFLQKFIRSTGIEVLLSVENLITAVITIGIVLVLSTKKRVQVLFDYIQVLRWYQYAAIICISLGGSMLVTISSMVLVTIDKQTAGNILHITSMLLIGVVVIAIVCFVSAVYGKDYYLKQNRLKEELLYTQQQYYHNMYENDREMRKFRHDIHSQLGCLHLLLSEGKAKQALEYLEEVESRYKKIVVYKYHTGNEILDFVINQKCLEAKKREVDIAFEGSSNKVDFINPYDLCTIFSNALQNGIEACDNVDNKERRVSVSIMEHGNTVFLYFKNPATEEMYKAVCGKNTTKADNRNHGFGVENIRIAAERNGGEVSYQYKEDKLVLEIFFET